MALISSPSRKEDDLLNSKVKMFQAWEKKKEGMGKSAVEKGGRRSRLMAAGGPPEDVAADQLATGVGSQ